MLREVRTRARAHARTHALTKQVLRRERDEMLMMVDSLKAEHAAALKAEQNRVAALEDTYA